MTTVIVSLWRNDAHRHLEQRAEHLLAKTSSHGPVRWRWVVGDSDDDTAERLARYALTHNIDLRVHDTHIEGEHTEARRRRGAATATEAFRSFRPDDAMVCLHESDLRSPSNVIDQLLTMTPPSAGMVFLPLRGGTVFYDIWAYRAGASHFGQYPPYHAVYRPHMPFEVDSFGSCWIAPRLLVEGRVLDDECVVGLCGQWRREGVTLTVSPHIHIEQPVELWEAR